MVSVGRGRGAVRACVAAAAAWGCALRWRDAAGAAHRLKNCTGDAHHHRWGAYNTFFLWAAAWTRVGEAKTDTEGNGDTQQQQQQQLSSKGALEDDDDDDSNDDYDNDSDDDSNDDSGGGGDDESADTEAEHDGKSVRLGQTHSGRPVG